MPQIRPISDLRNNFAEISRIVHESAEPVYLTKNGHGSMVVMSVELFEELEINAALIEQKSKQDEKAAKDTSSATKLKIQKPLSLWQKTLSDLVSE